MLGIDASPKMIAAAREQFSSEKAEFRVVDCCFLGKEAGIVDGGWDKV